MRYKRTVPRHVEEWTQTSRVVCDGCGDRIDIRAAFDHTEITIEAKIGEMYPEADMRTTFRADVCAKCWAERVMPALAAAGIKVHEHDADADDRCWETE